MNVFHLVFDVNMLPGTAKYLIFDVNMLPGTAKYERFFKMYMYLSLSIFYYKLK